MEVISETDDVLMEKYLEGEALTVAELKAGIRQATIDLKIFPALCGTAFKNKGIQTLLDAVVDYLPSPLDKPPVEGIDPHHHDKIEYRKAEDSEPFAALAFKIINDPFGKLGFVRIYSGSIKTGDTMLNPRTGKTERVGRLVKMHANKREDVTEVLAGDICACVGLKELKTGDTLCDSASSDCAGRDHLPGDGHLGRHRAEDQGRSGEDGRCAGAPCRRGSHLQGANG